MGGIGLLYSSGMITSLPADKIGDNNYDPWYVLQTENEEIEFKEGNVQRKLNSLMIEAENTPLYINIDGYILYIPANENRAYDFEKVEKIQVMNQVGTKLRWAGMYY